MSVKRIYITAIVAILLTVVGILTISGTAKTDDRFKFDFGLEKIEIKSPKNELKELNQKYEEVNKDLDETNKQQTSNQKEVEKLQLERDELLKQKQELEAQLQAKIENKRRLAEASAEVTKNIKPSGTANASSYSTESIKRMIAEAAVKHGLSPDRMLRIANCESTFNPNAVNKNYYAGGGNPSGLYQYLPETWNRIGGRSPYGRGAGPSSRFDAQHNINVTMWAFANGYGGEWECN